MSAASRRVLVVGLDGLEPALAFERFRDAMPCLSRLRREGAAGRMRSTVPPVTVPAWATMTSGLSPGALGVYGFRNLRRGSYEMDLVSARSIRAPRLWDLASDAGLRTVVFGVPPTFPPPPVHGSLVSCFLTPSADHAYTHPASLRAEMESRFGRYLVDVPRFRGNDRARILADLEAMTEQHFEIARWLIRSRDWELFMMVEIGPDRLHHSMLGALLGNADADPDLAEAGRRYYARLDAGLSALVEEAGSGTTTVVLSDHGARPMEGGLHVNEWLRRAGFLRLHGEPRAQERFDPRLVDWDRTLAWCEGGYTARVFLNVRGREPRGVVSREDYESVRSDVARGIEALEGPSGAPMGNVALRPEDLYPVVHGTAPDLVVVLGDLAIRALGSIGGGVLHATENDTGPDQANHAWDGVFAFKGGGAPGGSVVQVTAEDVAPTILGALGVEPPRGLRGRRLFS